MPALRAGIQAGTMTDRRRGSHLLHRSNRAQRSGVGGRDKPGHDVTRRVGGATFTCAMFLVTGVALAETPAGKVYAPVSANYEQAENDAALSSLLSSLRSAVQAHDVGAIEAALSPSFVALDCAANPLKACGPGKAKAIGKAGKPIDRMRLAFCCEGKPSADMPVAAQDETMFAILQTTLNARSLGANPDARGQVCAPALPFIDRTKAAKAAKAAGVEPENLRMATAELPLRARAAKSAPVTTKLSPGDLAPVVTDLTSDTPPGWTAIGMPDGSIAYTDALGLEELTPGAICFGKDKGQWKIVATIQRNS
jgi:hypothetical protein